MRVAACRSYLFVPGHRPGRFAKALAAGADAVIIDLEDAVAPADKSDARAAVAALLSTEHRIVLRINGINTPWFDEDVALCKASGVAAVMLPKAERVEDLLSIATDAALLPLIETAAGMDNVKALSRAPRVERLVFGSIDFQLDIGMQGGHEELAAFRSQLVLASRLADIAAPVDGVTAATDDLTALKDDALRARRLGFGGKLCVHPRQVAAVNEAFSPSDADVAWARRVVEAAAACGGSVAAVEGSMIDKPVILRAEAILRDAKALLGR